MSTQHDPAQWRNIVPSSCFATFIAAVARRFAGPAPSEDAARLNHLLNVTLRDACDFLGADRGRIILVDEAGDTLAASHLWTANDVQPKARELQDMPFGYFPWVREQLLASQTVEILDVSALPQEAEAEQTICAKRSAQSVLLVPMICRDRCMGFLEFDSVRGKRRWTREEKEQLTAAAEIMAAALMRHEELTRLRANEERLRLTMEATTDGVWDYDTKTRDIILSDKAAALLGLDSTSIKNGVYFLLERIHPDDIQSIQDQFHAHMTNQQPRFEGVCRIAVPSGEWRHVCVRGMIVSWRGRQPLRILGTIEDVGRLREAELNRMETEKKYRQLFEMETDAIFVIDDADGTILEANAATEDMYGYSRQYLLGMPFESLATRPAPISEESDNLHGEGRAMLQLAHKHCDGTTIPVEISMRRIPWQGRSVRIAAVRDISDRLRAQEAIDRQRRFLKTVIDAEPSMILVRDRSRRVMLANVATCQFYDRSEEQLLGRTGRELLPSLYYSEPFSNEDDLLYAGQLDQVDNEYKVKDRSDNQRWLRIIRRPLRDADDNVTALLSVGIDLTEAKQLKAELVRTGQLASLGEIAAGLAHEITNPVNGIINYAQVLIDMLEDDGTVTDSGSQFLGKIITEGERIAHLAHGVLGFARNYSNTRMPCAMDTMVGSVLDLVDSRLIRDGIKLTVDIPANLPAVHCVHWEFQQVLLNLISNARFALNERYPKPHPDKRLFITARQENTGADRKVVIMVEDHGTGIDPAHINDVFDPFFTTKPVGEGTGLGLSISRSIILDHDGTLALEQPEGGGTRVRITLPAAEKCAENDN
ncbi:PAS domain S-box protein [Oceanidesulfovibrio marinus]|uniref:histidine kinase n=1 Tax=Oceanidesulfovibrio marinus TaxID=370038 RepID=A0ABX6NEF3_9BACT|nr:PAS domain S-box protein [Oceanidesulfovibrio marinus]QJT08972.1 PAS domain S-box protein [Oceanidesulfovibrio marinus]